jgi:hypothetical protein
MSWRALFGGHKSSDVVRRTVFCSGGVHWGLPPWPETAGESGLGECWSGLLPELRLEPEG